MADQPAGWLADVHAAVEDGRFEVAARLLDDAELEDPAAFETPDWPHALHMLLHMLAFQLEDARFVYKRAPKAAQTGGPGVPAAWALLQRLWARDYEAAWPALAAGDWPPPAAPVAAAALAERLRRHVGDLVGRAYSSLSPGRLASLLGTDEAGALAAARARGWRTDAADGLVDVPPPPPAAGGAAARLSLQRLAEYVSHLEG